MRAAACLAVAVMLAGCSGSAALLETARAPSLPDTLLGPRSVSILVEVAAVAGRQPDPAALDHLEATLEDVTGKPVLLAGPGEIAAQGGAYDEARLLDIHRATGFFAGEGGYLQEARAVLHVLYLDGRMAGDGDRHRTLGRSLVDAGVVAIFRDTYAGAYRQDADGVRSPAVADMDAHVLLHEVGHLLGLVGNGVPMLRDHDADGHPGHSRYPESVMYHHPPMTPDQLVSGPVSIAFDVDDLSDLVAHRAWLQRSN